MAEKPKKTAKSRYDKSPRVAEKDQKGEKETTEKQDTGHKEAAPKGTASDGPSVKSETHADKGKPTAPAGDAPTGTEDAGIPVHARHAMERAAMHDKHMREHADMHMRHEREHRMGEH